ncbi:SMI1/KNR4 family protein [Legionella sp. km535]|uniref:SMI1/KNR4 family protein n=1 Tax=Legionella sp. km535 TaxID=2498107 RepID=UPI000F8C7AE1|nr:SMI1/KNR4 family protein [Legionella sp. km535]RUR17668.1 SMI1/KNR4 family protein [Legionella sp. km535]
MEFFEDREFPFTFCSTEKMLEHAKSDCSWAELYGLSPEEIEDEEIFSGEINPLASCRDWLHLGENMICYSNLYIDFNPSQFGKEGQIIFYMHDPDSYFSIADSFADFLKMNLDSNFEYLICD